MMKILAPLLTLSLLAGCATTDPRYREVTLLDNGNYALSSQSVDAFQSERDVVHRAREYCTKQQRSYREIDQKSSYVNGASGPMHRVTVYFQCPDAADASAAPVPGAATTSAAAAGTVAASSVVATTAAPASGSAVSTGAASTTPAASTAAVSTAAVSTAAAPAGGSATSDPKPPYQEVTALSDSRFGVTRQSLEPFQSSQAVLAQARSYCEQRQLHVDEIDRQNDYVKGSGNEQAHRVTLYFRCQSAATAAALAPKPPFQAVTALGDGRYGITRQSLEPFQAGRAVQAQADRYCGEQQQHAEQIDQQERYVNRGSNEPAHRTTLYFRCTP